MSERTDALVQGLLKSFNSAFHWAKQNECGYTEAAELLEAQASLANRLVTLGDCVETETLKTISDSLSDSFRMANTWASNSKCSYSPAAKLLKAQAEIAGSLAAVEEVIGDKQQPPVLRLTSHRT
jgi:hypothetical protein